jgi:hypothetical protein
VRGILTRKDSKMKHMMYSEVGSTLARLNEGVRSVGEWKGGKQKKSRWVL